MNIGIEHRLGLHLKLHPQVILMLKLLPLTALELESLVRQELEQNPVLEESDDGGFDETGEQVSAAAETGSSETSDAGPAAPGTEADGTPGLISETEEGPGVASPESAEFLSLLDAEDYHLSPRVEGGGSSETDPMELTPSEGPGLAEALLPGLRAELTEEDVLIAEVVLQSVDADGLLTVEPAELAETQGLDPTRLEAVLARIRRIEPGGITCRTRPEALLVQLEMHGYAPDSLEYRLVAEHWALLLQVQLGKIARLCGVSERAVHRAAEVIHGLEMRPARRFTVRPTEYVSPDFTVFWRDDKLQFEYNDDREPRLRLARRYVEMLRNPGSYPREQVEFARGKYNRAVLFLKAIESRRLTLRRLMKALLELQYDFFVRGPEHLRSASMRDAADRIDVHPSTVSRAGSGKYVETEFGIFPMKFFFKAGASDKSRVSIKEFIRRMIDGEDPSAPLSDDEIETRLREQHSIKLSRRTVNKYRAELGIPPRSSRVVSGPGTSPAARRSRAGGSANEAGGRDGS
ncbi:MAG: RNA polymerase factor sigma-54 [bacterium]